MPYLNVRENIARSKKKWYKENPNKELRRVNNRFITFLEKSGERQCKCAGGVPTIIKDEFKDSDGNIGNTVKVCCSKCGVQFYKEPDFYFIMLILGRKGGGKTTFVFSFTDIIHAIDPFRKIKIWQCPPNLITAIHNVKLCRYYHNICQRLMGETRWEASNPTFVNPDERQGGNQTPPQMPPYQANGELKRVCKFKQYDKSEDCLKCPHCEIGKKYYSKIDRLNEIEYNDIVVIDEGIISVNAKEALSKKMRNWDKFLAVARHKRVILFVLFQRFEVIKSLREMSDIIVYKRLPQKLIENEKEDMIIKQYGKKIQRLKQWQSIIAADHNHYDELGILENKVPYWYTEEISMSYVGDTSFIDEREEHYKDIDRANMIAEWLIQQNLPMPIKPAEVKGCGFLIRENFKDIEPALKNSEITLAMSAYYKRVLIDGEGTNSDNDKFAEQFVEKIDDVYEKIGGPTVGVRDIKIFEEICNGRSVTDFKDPPYEMSKQQVSIVMRSVGKYLLEMQKQNVTSGRGDEGKAGIGSEIRVVSESWNNGGFSVRSASSGGERNGIPAPDCIEITPEGRVRPVQVKERTETEDVSFKPLTFNTELKVAERISEIAKKTTVTCPYCLEKFKGVLVPDKAHLYITSKDGSAGVVKEPIDYADNKMTLRLNKKHMKIERQSPDVSKIKSPKIIDFLASKDKIFNSSEDPDKIENDANNEYLDEIVEFEKLYEEVMASKK